MNFFRSTTTIQWMEIFSNFFMGLSGVFMGEMIVHLFYLSGDESIAPFIIIGLLVIISLLVGLTFALLKDLFKP